MHDTRSGYVLLISVIVIGAVASAIAVSLLLMASGTTRSLQAVQQGATARAMADACAEEGLQRIRDTTTFTGSGSLAIGSSTCAYSVTGMSVPKTVLASSTVGDATRRVSVTVSATSPRVTISTWAEVPN